MLHVNVHEAKTKLSALLSLIETKGEEIYICRNGKAIAELKPIATNKNPLAMNKKLAAIKFHDDPMKPLDPQDWPPPAD